MKRRIATALIILLSLPAQAETKLETIAEGLENPWGLAFLPDGGMVVTERPGGFALSATAWFQHRSGRCRKWLRRSRAVCLMWRLIRIFRKTGYCI